MGTMTERILRERREAVEWERCQFLARTRCEVCGSRDYPHNCSMCGELLTEENHSRRDYEDCDFCYEIDHEEDM